MSELELKLKLTADGKGMTGTVRASREQIEQLNKSVRQTGDAGKAGAKGLDEVDRAGRRTTPGLGNLDGSVKNLTKSLAGLVSGAVALRELNNARRDAQLFGAAIAEVSTLMDDVSELDTLAGQASNLTREFGGLPVDQVKSFYSIYSAGAENAADATAILSNANRLTIGGVTQLGTAVDGLTSVLNAYQMEGERAGEVSDAFFVAMRGGKTTVDEIASSIGGVASIASGAGVELDQLLASVAAITKGGVGTSEAMNQVRQAIVSVVKPTQDAKNLAEELSLEFSVAALQSKGLAGFLDEVREATGGSLEQMGRLFGSVEALNAVVTLTGPQAGSFAALLDEMANKAGATDAAFSKMAGTLDQQIKQLSGQFAVLRTESGMLLGEALLPMVTAFNDNFDLIMNTTAVVGGAAAAYAAYRLVLLSATAAQVAFNAALAANPLTLAILALGAGGAALLTYSARQKEATDTTRALNQESQRLANTVRSLADSYTGLTEAQLLNRQQQLQELQRSLAEEVRLLEEQATGFEVVNIQLDIVREMYASVTEELNGLNEALSRNRERSEEMTDAVAKIIQQLEQERDTFGMTSVELARYNVLSAGGTAAQAELAASIAQTTANLEAEDKAAKSLRDGLAALIDELDPARAAFDAFVESQAFLDKGLEAGLLSPERYRDLTDRLVQSLADTGDEGGKEAADNFEREMRAASERVASSLQNAITSGDWGGVGASIGGALAGAIGGMVTESLMQQMSGSAGAAIFGPIGGAIAGGIVGLAANQLGGFFSLGDWDPTAERQASQGAGSVLGDINAKSESIARATRSVSKTNEELVGLNRGMLQALQTLQTGITGASTRVAQGRARTDVGAPSINANFFENFGVVGGAAETYLNTLGEVFTLGLFDSLGSSIGKLLGGKSRKVDEGINVVGGALADLMDETIVEAYSTFRVKKNFLSSTKTKEQTQRLGGDVANQFSLVFESIFDSVFAAGSALGMSDSELQRRLGGFRVGDLRISLEGLNAEQQQKEIEAVFGKVFDDLALYALPFLEDFQRAGEGLGETLARVASQTQVAEEAAKRLGFGWANLADRQLVSASERLVEAAGGLEQFIGSMESFIGNFASEAEQFAIAQSDITRALAEQNLMLPATRDGYFELLQAQNGATQAGAENIATLLRLQGVADKYYTMLEDSASELLRKQRDEYSAALQEAERAAMSVRSAIDGLNRSSGAFLDTSRAAAQEYLRGLVNRGAVPGGRQLDAALSSVTDIRADQFASFNDYIAEVSSTGRLLADLDEITRAQVTVEQQMLDRLDRQAELLERGNAEQLAALAQIQGSVDRNTQAIQAAPRGGAVSSRIGGGTGTVSATQDVAREVRQMKSEMVEFQKSIDRHSQRTARILERIERDGLEVRQ
uniref:Phage tail tape measure protein domain-containing protein n=1 Tax=Marinobacter nauticus TaxID=2743 RepID=A0A455W6R6_MARNT|nr:hypothetical protein YBY_29950 [Marinobacter nauticus]